MQLPAELLLRGRHEPIALGLLRQIRGHGEAAAGAELVEARHGRLAGAGVARADADARTVGGICTAASLRLRKKTQRERLHLQPAAIMRPIPRPPPVTMTFLPATENRLGVRSSSLLISTSGLSKWPSLAGARIFSRSAAASSVLPSFSSCESRQQAVGETREPEPEPGSSRGEKPLVEMVWLAVCSPVPPAEGRL